MIQNQKNDTKTWKIKKKKLFTWNFDVISSGMSIKYWAGKMLNRDKRLIPTVPANQYLKIVFFHELQFDRI